MPDQTGVLFWGHPIAEIPVYWMRFVSYDSFIALSWNQKDHLNKWLWKELGTTNRIVRMCLHPIQVGRFTIEKARGGESLGTPVLFPEQFKLARWNFAQL